MEWLNTIRLRTKLKTRLNSIKHLTVVPGSGAAAAVSVFEDRFKPNMGVRLTVFLS